MEANFDFQAEWERFAEVVEPNALLIVEFCHAYVRLAQQGRCDTLGSSESNRVYKEWHAAGRPRDVEAFIVTAANRPPD